MASALARRVPLTRQVYACFTGRARGRVASGPASAGWTVRDGDCAILTCTVRLPPPVVPALGLIVLSRGE